MVWAGRRDARELHVLVDDSRSDPDQTAAEWSVPPIVWVVEGRTVTPAVPAPPPAPAAPPAPAMAFAGLLTAGGADPVVEWGVLVGEVLGLEVARVVDDGVAWRLEVGVGCLDRGARAEMRPHQIGREAVAEVVRVVRDRRRPGVPRHPANTLARERWLRAAVIADPSLVGMSELTPVPPPLPGRGLRQGTAAPAAGTDPSGRHAIVVCSTGVDVDVVPTAADARRAHGRPDDRLVIAVPRGDDYPVTRALAASLRHPAEVVVVDRDWETPTPTG
jgi:hypothetical protein